MDLVFFGSSEFSLQALEACLEAHRVLTVISTPDQKKGRGLQFAPTPVKEAALKKGLPVETPETLKAPEIYEKVAALKPELFVVSSYGKIIPAAWLKIPSKLCLNVHPSLLPKYRGAAPVNWPILNGDAETGISIAEVTPKLDAGDVFYQEPVALEDRFDAASLSAHLAAMSKAALKIVFEKIGRGTLERKAQDESLSTYARKLEKEDGAIDWQRPARHIFNQVRGLLPWPTAFAGFETEPLQILQAKPLGTNVASAKPGQLLEAAKEEIRVQTGEGALAILKVRPAGKKEMSGGDFARGRRLRPGFIFEPGNALNRKGGLA